MIKYNFMQIKNSLLTIGAFIIFLFITPPLISHALAACIGGVDGGGGSDQYDNPNGAHITQVSFNCNGQTCDVNFSWENKGSGDYKLIWFPARSGAQSYEAQDFNSQYSATIGGFKQGSYYGVKIARFINPVQYGTPYCGMTPNPPPAPTATPVPTNTPIPLPTATPTPLPVTSCVTQACSAGYVCMSTYVCLPAVNTQATAILHINGIDTANYAFINRTRPNNISRQLTLYFYPQTTDKAVIAADWKGKKAFVFNGNVTWPTRVLGEGLFQTGNFPLTGLPDGTYYVLAKLQDGSIREFLSFPSSNNSGVPSETTVIKGGSDGTVNVLSSTDSPIELHLGDIAGNVAPLYEDNVIDATDYNILRSCYGTTPSSVPSGCLDPNWNATTKRISPVFQGAKNGLLSDLNDDGYVDEYDYNLLLRSMKDVPSGS